MPYMVAIIAAVLAQMDALINGIALDAGDACIVSRILACFMQFLTINSLAGDPLALDLRRLPGFEVESESPILKYQFWVGLGFEIVEEHFRDRLLCAEPMV